MYGENILETILLLMERKFKYCSRSPGMPYLWHLLFFKYFCLYDDGSKNFKLNICQFIGQFMCIIYINTDTCYVKFSRTTSKFNITVMLANLTYKNLSYKI